MQVMTVVGRDQRKSGLFADFAQRLVVGRVQLVVLELEVVAAGEHLRVRLGGLARLVHAIRAEPSRELTGETSGEHDQSIGKLGEDFLVDARFVVEAVLVRGGEQLAEVAVSGTILREQDQMKISAAVEVVAARNLRAIGALARRQVSLASDDRFYPRSGGLLKELDRSKHVAVIGHRESFHAGGFRVFDQRPDFVGAVEQAVLRVDVKMNETHSAIAPAPSPSSESASS